MDKQNVVYLYDRVLFSLKKEGNTHQGYNMQGQQGPKDYHDVGVAVEPAGTSYWSPIYRLVD